MFTLLITFLACGPTSVVVPNFYHANPGSTVIETDGDSGEYTNDDSGSDDTSADTAIEDTADTAIEDTGPDCSDDAVADSVADDMEINGNDIDENCNGETRRYIEVGYNEDGTKVRVTVHDDPYANISGMNLYMGEDEVAVTMSRDSSKSGASSYTWHSEVLLDGQDLAQGTFVYTSEVSRVGGKFPESDSFCVVWGPRANQIVADLPNCVEADPTAW